MEASHKVVETTNEVSRSVVGERIGHAFRNRAMYVRRLNFTYTRSILGVREHVYEDVAAEQFRAVGPNPKVLVLRKRHRCESEKCSKFEYARVTDTRVGAPPARQGTGKSPPQTVSQEQR